MTREEYKKKITGFDNQKAIRSLKIKRRYKDRESFTFMGTEKAKALAYEQYISLRKKRLEKEIEQMCIELEIEIFGAEGKEGALKNLRCEYSSTKIILPGIQYSKN